jgi:CBS domain-containing protein
MRVEHILQSKGAQVFSVSGDATLSEAVQMLNDKNIGAVVVKSGEKVMGILSERDIVRQLKKGGVAALQEKVKTCMTVDISTCGLDTTLDELMTEMTVRRIRHIPVVEAGSLVGIVSIGDVVKRKIENVEQEAAALRDYIAS